MSIITMDESTRTNLRYNIEEFVRETLLPTLTGDKQVNDSAVDEWVGRVSDMLHGLVANTLTTNLVPPLPIEKRERQYDVEEWAGSDRELDAHDVSNALRELDEADELDPLDDEEQAIRRFLMEADSALNSASGGYKLVIDHAVDDAMQEGIDDPKVFIPDWLNDAIDWEDVANALRRQSNSVTDNNGNTWYVMRLDSSY